MCNVARPTHRTRVSYAAYRSWLLRGTLRLFSRQCTTSRLISRGVVCLGVLVALITTNEVQAGLSPLDASILIQSTASDTDAIFLSRFAGFQSGQILNYNAISTTTSWSATLSGTYL